MIVFVSCISKVEYIIEQIFIDNANHYYVNKNVFKYSLVKAILMYRPTKVIYAIYNDIDNLIFEIKNFLHERILENKQNLDLKVLESKSFNDLLIYIENNTNCFEVSWDYNNSFIEFNNFLINHNINDYTLLIDREGDSSTLNAALNQGLINVLEEDSHNSIGIRFADILIGIIGKLLKNLNN